MTTRSAPAIVYPETDGMPLPDGEYQAPIYRRIVRDLDDHYKDVAGVNVNGDTFIYYVEGNPRRSFSPDCYVVFGLTDAALESLSLEGNNTYLLWEIGKAPDFILEIGSPSTAATDMGRKRELYAELGVGEYWRFDATGGEFYGEPLVGERLVDGEYRRLEMQRATDGRVWAHSEALNLELWWTDGDLRFWDPARGELASEARGRACKGGGGASRSYGCRGARGTEERIGRMTAEHRSLELRKLACPS